MQTLTSLIRVCTVCNNVSMGRGTCLNYKGDYHCECPPEWTAKYVYCVFPKFLGILAIANSADPDQTAPTGSALFATV